MFGSILGTSDARLGNISLGFLDIDIIYNRTINENIDLVEDLTFDIIVDKTISESLSLVEDLISGSSVEESLTPNETLTYQKISDRTIEESITLNETNSKSKINNPTIEESIELVELIIKNITQTQTVNESIEIREGKNQSNGFEFFFVESPDFSVVPRKCRIILQGYGAIVLPCPEYGDTESNLNKVIIRRSMNNVLMSYVRKNEIQKIKYDFILGRGKTIELQTFLRNNNTRPIIMLNWKGEKWNVKITSNPVDMVGKSKWDNEGERYDVTLEFKGIKLV